MAEKKKGKKRKDEYVHPGEEIIDKPSKEEFAVAKWMRKNVQIKKTKFLNHNVEYFTGTRAVDALMESPFAKRPEDTRLFETRKQICDYLHIMLIHKFFHRARKVPVDERELEKARKGKKKKSAHSAEKESGEDEKKEKVEVKGGDNSAENSVVEGNKEQPQAEKEKRKKKIRLDMHNDQCFVDSLDAYVWIYDPIPFHYWIIGTLLVLGAIGVCLFPLWPPSVRLGVYYLSVAVAGFLVSIIVLAVIRLIIFCLIWLLTLGKHHLWILPNLTEDVGFFASFWPLYTYEYKGDTSNGSTKKSKKKKKEKDSDAEDEEEDKQDEKSEEKQKLLAESRVEDVDDNGEGNETHDAQGQGGSESESETSQRSSTGKDFEMVDQEELES